MGLLPPESRFDSWWAHYKIYNMKIEVSDYYKLKGYSKAYLYKRKDDRMAITLTGIGMKPKGILYSKYLYCSFYQCDVTENEHIDHINGDKTDDRIENLQKISRAYNIKKDKHIKEYVERICPVCGNIFLLEKRNVSTHPNPCCSCQCRGKKSRAIQLASGVSFKHKFQGLSIDSIKNDIAQELKQKEIASKYSISVSTLKRFLHENNIKML